MMWFGLYSRANNQLDSSGFEHIFVGQSVFVIKYNLLHYASLCLTCTECVLLFVTYFSATGEIKGGKVSGFHNWLQFYINEKRGFLDYYSHNFNGPVSI